MLYERIKKEQARLEEQIKDLKSKISVLPKGKLICTHGKDGFRWYNSHGHDRKYIPKKERPLAEQLAIKKYYSLQLEAVEQEKRALEFYIRHHSTFPGKAEHLFADPAYQQLLQPWIQPVSLEAKKWLEVPYEKNRNYPEKLIHKTTAGGLVRSKSESLIAHFLYIHKIPFRYECALSLEETVIYPDFTIYHPSTGKIYYWEHFGRMDDSRYARNAAAKLQIYISHQIIPTIQLITTYETMDSPLSIEAVERVIQEYFL